MNRERTSYRILVVDDQFLTREGLKMILEYEEDMEVVGMAMNGLEAYEKARELQPDLVLMDVRMPVMDGIESIKLIKKDFPDIVVLILTTFVEDDYIVEGLVNGASGYILKDLDGDKLVSSIRDAANGQFVLQGVVAAKLAGRVVRSEVKSHVSERLGRLRLTEREEEVARLLITGLSNREIAEQLNISDGTVRNYISLLYSKMDVRRRAEAVVQLLQYLHE